MRIRNRTFIVSGGSSGLGLATVKELVQQGANVAILDRSEPPADFSSPKIKFFEIDITQTEQIKKAVENIISWTRESGLILGGVVNCAGVATAAKILDSQNEPHSMDVWNFAISVNLTGSFDLTRLVLPHLAVVHPEDETDGERGVVIFVSSSAAFEGQPGQTAYAATKGALNAMVLPMARDLGRYGIRVAAIAPGVFQSTMTDLMPPKTRKNLQTGAITFPRRFGQPEEFAQTVKFIIETKYMNGETIRLSGAGRLPGKL